MICVGLGQENSRLTCALYKRINVSLADVAAQGSYGFGDKLDIEAIPPMPISGSSCG